MAMGRMTLTDFTRYLVFLLQKDNAAVPCKDQRLWHTLMYQLKEEAANTSAPACVQELWFDSDDSYHKSPDVARVLLALSTTGVIEGTRQRYEECRLSAVAAAALQRYFYALDAPTREYLEAAAVRTRKRIEAASTT
ncbi:hypothetical protein HYS79_00405 [Patescibacteria group bacterium]|nr:hypothetical protein [Patescibacteria group bacterium]